jgi:uncharacterized membrane protein
LAGLAIVLHLLSAIVWVGGMSFALFALRPAAETLQGPVRLRLWAAVFSRFFPIVLASVVLLLVTGYVLLFGRLGGFAGAPVHVHIMHLLGWIMALLFLHLYFAPWRRFRRAVESDSMEQAAGQLGQIRRTVQINLVLGVLTSAAGVGRYWL